jgi:hypothetical protein
MILTPIALLLAVVSAAPSSASENPVFKDLISKGVAMSDGASVKLPPPVLADGLDAIQQTSALAKAAGAHGTVADLVKTSYYAPVVVKVRTTKQSEGEGPAVRTLDVWFVAHGDWNVLTSDNFLESAIRGKSESATKGKEEVAGRVVLNSGVLTDKELNARKLSVTVKKDYEERFVYATFSLFERVELSATRFSALTRGNDSILAAGRLDPRFLNDADYPNQWRPLVRDERAEIKPGKAHPLEHAGGYAKITRLLDPTDGVFVECHIVYEEPYGWFDGVNLVKQKTPIMVQEKVRTFRRKLTLASGEKGEKK